MRACHILIVGFTLLAMPAVAGTSTLLATYEGVVSQSFDSQIQGGDSVIISKFESCDGTIKWRIRDKAGMHFDGPVDYDGAYTQGGGEEHLTFIRPGGGWFDVAINP